MKSILTTLGWIYFGATFLAFLLGAHVTLTGWWPSSWQVPWSDLGSFVETKDGVVLADIKMWSRIELYDREGRFLKSWRQPLAKGDLALATDENGAVYFRHANTVYKFDSDGKVAKNYVSKARLPRTWELSALTSEPVFSPETLRRIERRIVKKGEILFSDDESSYFLCADNTHLERRGASIVRYASSEERLATYRSPRYYWPLQFPFPAVLGLVAGFVLTILQVQQKKGPS